LWLSPCQVCRCSARRDVMSTGRVGSSRSCLLTLYRTTAPSYSRQLTSLPRLPLASLASLGSQVEACCHHFTAVDTRHACVQPVAATAANPRRWSTSARHRHRLRRPVGSHQLPQRVFTVHWQSRWYARAAKWSPYRCHVPRRNVARHRFCRFSTSALHRLPSGRSSTPATTVRAADDVDQPWWSGSCVRVRRSSVVHRSRRLSKIVRVAVCSSCVGFFFCHRGSNLPTNLFSHYFPETPVVHVQWLGHFWHYNRSFLLTL